MAPQKGVITSFKGDSLLKNVMIVLSVLLLGILVTGCGGDGGDDKGTKPVIMTGYVNFSSETTEPKVALVTLDPSDNWVTVSSSGKIGNSGEWNKFFLDLPIVGKDAVYAIVFYNDRNRNGKYDEVDEENLVKIIDYYAVYDASSNRWTVEDMDGRLLGRIPTYQVEIIADYTKSAVPLDIINPKEVYKSLQSKVLGR